MAISKPNSVRSFLGSWFCNPSLVLPPSNIKVFGWTIASKGSWFNMSFPFGDTIEITLDILIFIINNSIDELWAAIRAIPSVTVLFAAIAQTIANQIAGVYGYIAGFSWTVMGWIANSAANVLRQVNDTLAWTASILWEGIRASKREIMEWTPGFVDSAIAAAILPFRRQLNILTTFADDIVDFFKDPEEWLLDKIEKMLVRFW